MSQQIMRLVEVPVYEIWYRIEIQIARAAIPANSTKRRLLEMSIR